MKVERSNDFILVALFLSRFGRNVEGGLPLPPSQLGTDSWQAAYAGFFDTLAAGRSLQSFRNSLKATRDQFDSHVNSGRRGWRTNDEPKPLPERDAAILDVWGSRSADEFWQAVCLFWDSDAASILSSVHYDPEAQSDQTSQEEVYVGARRNIPSDNLDRA